MLYKNKNSKANAFFTLLGAVAELFFTVKINSINIFITFNSHSDFLCRRLLQQQFSNLFWNSNHFSIFKALKTQAVFSFKTLSPACHFM